MEGSRTYPTDQVTGEEVDWIVPRLTANANTVKVLYSSLCVRDDDSFQKQATYGEIDANALDWVFERTPFVWNALRVAVSKSICHERPVWDWIDVEPQQWLWCPAGRLLQEETDDAHRGHRIVQCTVLCLVVDFRVRLGILQLYFMIDGFACVCVTPTDQLRSITRDPLCNRRSQRKARAWAMC